MIEDSGDVGLIPVGIMSGLTNYTIEHRATGDFLKSVLSNDLREAVVRADPGSLRALKAILFWLIEYAPPSSWGSPTKYKNWTAPYEESIRPA